jgi:hypothetical protein
MRVLDEQNLRVLWNWSDEEQQELASRFKDNLVDLLALVRRARGNGKGMAGEDVEALAAELQEAAERLDAYRQNCMTVAGALRAPSPEKPEK